MDDLRQDGLFELVRRDRPLFNAGLRVDVERHSNAVATLVRCYLWVHFRFVAQALLMPG
ncbi:MAG TPA: hypothetical protein VKU19_13575 [Bryobacteraceae bacterium]|nr:hypothetical protein [Bryobacteraceae bacterium]